MRAMGLLGNIGDSMINRLGFGSPKGGSDYRGTREAWQNETKKWSDAWGKVNQFDDPTTGQRTDTGKRFDELSGLYTGEVDKGAAQAGQQTAAAYSRRGMGDSGYATGGQQSVMLSAALERAKAREAARQAAVGEAEGILGQQSQISLSPYPSLFQAAAQRYMQNEQQMNQFKNAQMMQQEQFAQSLGGFAMGGGFKGG
jgi:hypothetical protein